jgi:hypothetical protein
MKKRFRIASSFFCRLLLTEMSCRSIDQRRNADTTATLSVTAQSASLGSLCDAARARAALLLQRFSVPNLFCRACARGIRSV